MGRRVTLIERGSQLASSEDADVAQAILQLFRDEGIDVLLGTNIVRVNGLSGKHVSLRGKGTIEHLAPTIFGRAMELRWKKLMSKRQDAARAFCSARRSRHGGSQYRVPGDARSVLLLFAYNPRKAESDGCTSRRRRSRKRRSLSLAPSARARR